MFKTFLQFFLGLVLFLMIILFPSKVAFLFVQIFETAWNIAVTVGQNIKIPGR